MSSNTSMMITAATARMIPISLARGIRLGIANSAVNVVVVGLQQLPDGCHGVEADLVCLLPVKGHGDQGVRPP